MKTPINKKTLSRHFQYSWWIYVLSAICCFFLWDIIFTVTAPRTPESEKLELYIYAYGDSAAVDSYFEEIHANDLEDVTELTALYVMPDETNGLMVLATRIMAGEGDLYLLPRDSFQSYAAQGLFVPLEEIDGIVEMCDDAGLNVERGWRKNQETGERHLYGLPTSSMRHIPSWTYSASTEMYLSVRLANGNDEKSEELLKIILRDNLPEADSTQEESGS